MATLGPIALNGGWVSDADIWNDPGEGKCFTYQCFFPWERGAKSCDNFSGLGTIPSATQILGAFAWQDTAQEGNIGTAIYIAMAPSKCYTTPINNISWTDRTNSVSLPGGNFYTFDVLNGKVILANSFQNSTFTPFKITAYNGNIAALGGSPPAGGIVKVVNNFCFLAQNLTAASTLSRVYWSNVADPETWGSSNFIDVSVGDGDIITGLSSIGSDLIIFKTNSIWRLSTITTTISGAVTLGPLTVISKNHGCVGQHALDVMPDGTIVFVSSDGHLYRTDGTTFTDLSHLPFPNSNMASDLISQDNYLYSPYVFVMVKVDSENHRIFTIFSATSTTQNFIYAFDYLYGGWSNLTNLNGGTDNVFYMTTLPNMDNMNTNFGNVRPRIVMGSYGGNIYMNAPWFRGNTQVFDESTSLTCTLEKTIMLVNGGEYFTPCWLTFGYQQPNNTGGTLVVYIGFDGVYQGNPVASVGMSGNGRVDVPITYNQTTPSAKRPYTMQVKIQVVANVSAGVTLVEPLYISDDVPA